MDTCLDVSELFWGHFDLTSGTSPIFVEERIPSLVCGYILGSQSVTHCLKITVSFLWSDL